MKLKIIDIDIGTDFEYNLPDVEEIVGIDFYDRRMGGLHKYRKASLICRME